MQFRLTADTAIVTLIVCGCFLLLTAWVQNEADTSSGTTKDILTHVAFAMDITNTLLLVAAMVIFLGVVVGFFEGDKKKDSRDANSADADGAQQRRRSAAVQARPEPAYSHRL